MERFPEPIYFKNVRFNGTNTFDRYLNTCRKHKVKSRLWSNDTSKVFCFSVIKSCMDEDQPFVTVQTSKIVGETKHPLKNNLTGKLSKTEKNRFRK